MKVLIAGGGIGGLATALSLHAAGIEAEVFEQAREIREVGVGINMLPHAVKELAALGLLPALDRLGTRTSELIYMNRLGQTVWQEPRGMDAGCNTPQVSIHRGSCSGYSIRPRSSDWARRKSIPITGWLASTSAPIGSWHALGATTAVSVSRRRARR